ncbi:MAG: TetR/AcrR family transcriptional regulator [Myxococcales bacterium]|jgi:TetR/AcrR family transcriptional regulator, transcriptional repressor for nem operon|nr:TetR/AcrR family transcriptional regulator [Myxococcales bacterium]
MSRTKEFDPERALDLALDIFWRRGYEGTTLRDLLEGMDISRQSLYDTFGDKRSLFLKVLERYERLMMEGLTVRHLQNAGSIEAVRGYCEYFLAEIVHDPALGSCLMANTAIEVGAADPEIQAIVRAYFGRLEGILQSVLAGARKAGEIGEDRDVRALARHLVNALHGLGIMGRSGASRSVLRQMLNMALSVLER